MVVRRSFAPAAAAALLLRGAPPAIALLGGFPSRPSFPFPGFSLFGPPERARPSRAPTISPIPDGCVSRAPTISPTPLGPAGAAPAVSPTALGAAGQGAAAAAQPRSPPKIPRDQEWIDKSVEYYTRVMRGEGGDPSPGAGRERSRTARRLYRAIQQVRSGNLDRAESIYRRTIRDIKKLDAEVGCDHAELATTTLLLALVLQRMNNAAEARAVFHRFFRQAVTEGDPLAGCACTAKVLGAYSLFEMKHGSVHRSIEVARRAAQFDGELSKLFGWKQFREARERISPPSRGEEPPSICSFVSEADMPNTVGYFRIRCYGPGEDSEQRQFGFAGAVPSAIYSADKPPLGARGKVIDLPLLFHDLGLSCEAFDSQIGQYKDRLEQSMRYVQDHGGVIICFKPEVESADILCDVDASAFHNRRPHGNQSDAYTECDAIPSILRDMRIGSVRLVSNGPTGLRMFQGLSLVRRLREMGVTVRGTVPLTLGRRGQNRIAPGGGHQRATSVSAS